MSWFLLTSWVTPHHPTLPSLNSHNWSNEIGKELPAWAATSGIFTWFLKAMHWSSVIKWLSQVSTWTALKGPFKTSELNRKTQKWRPLEICILVEYKIWKKKAWCVHWPYEEILSNPKHFNEASKFHLLTQMKGRRWLSHSKKAPPWFIYRWPFKKWSHLNWVYFVSQNSKSKLAENEAFNIS